MIKTHTSIHINRPVQEVWDFLMDLDNLSYWQSGSPEIRATDGLNKGSVLSFTAKGMGHTIHSSIEVVENDGHSYYEVISLQGPLEVKASTKLTAEQGGTLLTSDSEGQVNLSLKIAESTLKYMSELRQATNLKVLKKVLEEGALTS